jgi:hypothetical protein
VQVPSASASSVNDLPQGTYNLEVRSEAGSKVTPLCDSGISLVNKYTADWAASVRRRPFFLYIQDFLPDFLHSEGATLKYFLKLAEK